MRRPVSIRRNHRTRDESRHRQPTARQTESPSILSSRPRLAVRKSFQTLDNGGQKRVTRLIFIEERAFTRSTAISIAEIISLLLVLLSSLVSLSFSFSFRSDRSIDSPFFSLLFNPRSTVHFLIVSNRSNHRRLSVPTIRRMTDHETHRSNKTRQITRSRAFQARIGESRQVEQLSDILENESRIIRIFTRTDSRIRRDATPISSIPIPVTSPLRDIRDRPTAIKIIAFGIFAVSGSKRESRKATTKGRELGTRPPLLVRRNVRG